VKALASTKKHRAESQTSREQLDMAHQASLYSSRIQGVRSGPMAGVSDTVLSPGSLDVA
jgi:hypothetical protein